MNALARDLQQTDPQPLADHKYCCLLGALMKMLQKSMNYLLGK